MRLVGGDDEVVRVGCYKPGWRRLCPVLPDEGVRQAQRRVEASPPPATAVHVPLNPPSEKPPVSGLRLCAE